jgi:hypothetical protein
MRARERCPAAGNLLEYLCRRRQAIARPKLLGFERSHVRALHYFERHGDRDMKLDDRLRLRLNVGKAIMDMHSNRK